MPDIDIPIKMLPHSEGLSLPCYATPGSVGLDLFAAHYGVLTLVADTPLAVPCGFSMELPPGYEAQIRSRSGLAYNNGVIVLNSPGTIDEDYRGEIKAILFKHTSGFFEIKRGMRIAQMVIAPVTRANWEQVAAISNTDRGAGGFGSTGMQQISR